MVITKTIESIAIGFEEKYQFDSAQLYHNKHLATVKAPDAFATIPERDSAVSNVYINMSFMELTKQQNSNALNYADSAIFLLKQYPGQSLLLRAYNNKAVALNNLVEFKQAIDLLILIQNEAKNLDDTIYANQLRQNGFINIGKNYLGLENWLLAIKYSKEALKIDTGNKRSLAISHLNISAAYLQLELLDSVFYHTKKCVQLSQEINNQFIEINALLNQISAHEKGEEYEKALKQSDIIIERSLSINHIAGYALALSLKGNVLAKSGVHFEAIKVFNKAVELGKKYQDFEYLEDCYESMSETFARVKDYDNAYKYYQLYDQINDSIRSEATQKSYNDILVKYETAQKEQQIIEKELEVQTKEATISNQQNAIILIAFGAGFLLLLGFIFYAHIKNKQKQAIAIEKENGFKNVINATEQERSRISKDLHDGIGQELSALKLSLNSVIDRSKDDDQKKELAKIASSFSNSADEVRSISHQMMPRALMEQGLIPAIDDLMKNAFQHSNTTFTLEESGINERFNERIEVSVYRIIQELINNIIKHAEANQVSVQLIAKGNNLLVFVEDDGKGFDASNQKEGHGLINIKSRTEMINGSVNFEPSSNKGTFVSLSIPLDNHA
ncbi:MAG: ATP-binding protein [Ekhidna sp.]